MNGSGNIPSFTGGEKIERTVNYRSESASIVRWCGDGMSCMMKSICQVSQIPVGDGSLVGELLNVMLTPDYGNTSFFTGLHYLRAAEAGRGGGDCSTIFPGCPESCGFLDHITSFSLH
uniref:AtpA_1 protein n=1 Tax=Fopius arisanus TaxID=64838 RepID=A0A0C9QY20_9HYME